MRLLSHLLKTTVALAAFVAFSITAAAQGLSGQVVDKATGDPLIGATVLINGTTAGAVTNLDGNFQVNVKPGTKLRVTYVGYEPLDVIAKDGMKIVLSEDNKELNEVVVIGYGSVKKKDATGSLTTIDADPKMKGVAPTADDILVGKVAGVTVTTPGGSATGGSTIRIRGGSSLSASNDPLIILDGVYLDNSGIGGVGNLLSTIDPNDIESFTVLKDASATAIYGSRASNGVILITTKQGKSGKLKITYDGNVTISTRKKKIDVLDGNEFQALIRKTFAGQSNQAEVYQRAGLDPVTGESVYNANTDWQDEVMRTAVSTQHNVSFLGSVANVLPFRASLGYTNNEGILKTDHMQRFSGSLNLNPTFFGGRLKVNLNNKLMYNRSRFANSGAIGAAISMDPTKPVYISPDDPNYGRFDNYWTWIGQDPETGLYTKDRISVATTNPLSLLEDWHDSSKVWNYIGSAQFEYNFKYVPGLKVNFNYSIDTSHSTGDTWAPYNAPAQSTNLGYAKNWNQTRTNQQVDLYATYARDFKNPAFHFDVMGGYSWQKYHVTNDWYTRSKFMYEDPANQDPSTLIADPTGLSTGVGGTEHYIISYFGRANLSLLDRYLFTFTLRDDGSSRFSKGNHWGIFPSLALAWRIIEEPWMQNQKVFSNLKLRLGWGKTGQQDINQGDYPYLGSYYWPSPTQVQSATYYRDGSWINLLKPNAYNPDIKWETTTTWNAGLDFGFLKNRINGAVDFYYRKTTNLINAEFKTAAGANFAEYVVANVGSLSNTGLEFTLNTIPIQTKDFQWNVDANLAWNKNKILKLTDGDNSTEIRRFGSTSSGDGSFQLKAHKVGHPAGMYYVYEQVYDENGRPLEGVFKDQNGDGIIDENDLRLYHHADPTVTFGLNTKLQYKAWDFSISSHGSLGNWNYNSVASNSAELAPARLFANAFLSNRTKYALKTNWQTSKVLSDYYVQNASFWRIDNITLGYSFKSLFGAENTGGRVYFTVQNPIVFTSYDGLDPEIAGGFDNNFYPRPVSFLFGVTLNL